MQPTSDTPASSFADPPIVNPASAELTATLSPEATANNLSEYFRAWLQRAKNGDSGMLPVIGGLVVIVIIFQSEKSVFLSAGNLTNLFQQAAAYILFAMAEVFVLLLGEIDLSIGFVGAVSAVATVAASHSHHPWWACVLLGLLVGAAIGFIQGTLITRLRVPSFVVTLAGLLGWEGVLIWAANREGGTNGGGTLRVTDKIMNDFVYGNLSITAGWVLLVVFVVAFAAFHLLRDSRRRQHGLVTPPMGLAIIRIVLVAAVGLALVLICSRNRGNNPLHPLEGVPWVVLINLGIFGIWSTLLDRTRFGRYIYAIGGNAEAARRAGISLNGIRTAAFTLTGMTAAMAGIILASDLGSISNDVDGGQLVLYAVAAAVIGGTSLFGGRGRMLFALVGGLVIATIANGMGLIGLSASTQYMVTALVLLAAASVDAVARRNTVRR